MSSQINLAPFSPLHPYSIPVFIDLPEDTTHAPQSSFEWNGALRQHFDAIDSTRTYALKHEVDFPHNQWRAISADEQTAGVRMDGRPWLSPSGGNVYVTFSFQLTSRDERLASLVPMATNSLVTLLQSEGLHAKSTAPGELFINGKNVGALGVDLVKRAGEENSYVCHLSVGLYVNTDPVEREATSPATTSLAIEAGHPFDPNEMLFKVYHSLHQLVHLIPDLLSDSPIY